MCPVYCISRSPSPRTAGHNFSRCTVEAPQDGRMRNILFALALAPPAVAQPAFQLKITGHFIMYDDPQWFFAQIDEFLGGKS
jgi:hypothetical protein